MNEAKEKKEAKPGRVAPSPSALPMIVMPPERRRAENAQIRHWMELGKKALNRAAEMITGSEEVLQESENELNRDS